MKTKIAGIIIVLALTTITGMGLLLVPFVSGEDALFTKEDHFISMVAKLDSTYNKDIESNIVDVALRAKRNAEYNEFKSEIDTIKKHLMFKRDSLQNRRKYKEAQALGDSIMSYDPILTDKYNELSDKYSSSNIPDEEINRMVANIKDTLTLEKYYEKMVSSKLDQKYAYSDFVVKRINRQDTMPFVFGGVVLILIGLIYLLYELQIISLNKIAIYGVVALLFAGFVAFMTKNVVEGIQKPVRFLEVSEQRDNVVKERLGLIRDAQKAYKSANPKGSYAPNFGTLTNWLKNGQVQIVKNVAGVNDTVAVYDTVRVAAFEHVFPKEKYGNVIVDSLRYVPFSGGVEFNMTTSMIKKARAEVAVLEVGTKKINYLEDVALENFDKKAIIKIGSMQEPTLNGNWGE